MIELTSHPQGIVVRVRVRPGAGKNALTGAHAGAIRVAVSAAPEKGKANADVTVVLAEALGCRPWQVEVISGETSREKKVLLTGIEADELRRRLESLIAELSPNPEPKKTDHDA